MNLEVVRDDLKRAYDVDDFGASDLIMESLEDEYHIDLTDFYGEPERVDELIDKLKNEG